MDKKHIRLESLFDLALKSFRKYCDQETSVIDYCYLYGSNICSRTCSYARSQELEKIEPKSNKNRRSCI